MSSGFATTAAPIASSAAALGIGRTAATPQPVPPLAQPAAPVVANLPVNSPNAQVATGYSATPAVQVPAASGLAAAAAANVSGGGVVEDAKAMIEQSFGSLTEMAQFRMTSLENQMDAEMKSKGTLDAATIQKYTNKMTSFEMIMQLAAKLQESKDNAIRAWLNR